MINTVVFDLGQVLCSPPDLFTRPAAQLGVEPGDYEEAYWVDRRPYDEGLSDAGYWSPLLRRLGVDPTPELVTHLAQQDADLWSVPRPAALALVREMRARGLTVVVLSNAPATMARTLERIDWRDQADHWFVSADLGLTKPHPEIYRHVTEVVGGEPAEFAFIDDREPNVTGAAEFGWLAHLWVDDEDSARWLNEVCPAR